MLRAIFICLVGAGTVGAADDASSNWPRFRGPAGDGHSSETSLPTKWDANSIQWKTTLPVMGQSSPIIWGEHIFLTGTTGSGDAVQRHVLCLDRRTQKVVWNKAVARGDGEKLHKMNTWATPSCATDGEVVVAFFGPGGLHGFDYDGELLWSRQLGDFPGAWGVGASPVIYGDLVIQNCDAQGTSSLLAVSRKTGKDVWKTPRRSTPRGGWSTPVLIETKDRQELVLNGEFGVQGYDPKTGKDLWFCKSFNGRGAPSPVFGHGLLYVVNGKPGDVYAVTPGGTGDVTSTHMAWHAPRGGGRDLPSPILQNKCVVVLGMKAIATGYDATTGKQLWKSRLGGNYSASPIAVNGLVYAAAEDGTVSVLKVGENCEVVAKNRLDASVDEIFRSSMAVSDGQLFLRSNKHLYCVGTRETKVAGK
jgi:outer membrane protein assembly factor BamB